MLSLAKLRAGFAAPFAGVLLGKTRPHGAPTEAPLLAPHPAPRRLLLPRVEHVAKLEAHPRRARTALADLAALPSPPAGAAPMTAAEVAACDGTAAAGGRLCYAVNGKVLEVSAKSPSRAAALGLAGSADAAFLMARVAYDPK